MTSFSSDLVDFEMRGKIAVLTLNRPEKRNAINETLIQDINRFFGVPPKEALAVVLRDERDDFAGCRGRSRRTGQGRDQGEDKNGAFHGMNLP